MLLLGARDAEAKGFFLINTGEHIVEVSDLKDEVRAEVEADTMAGVKIGILHSRFGVFWLDIWRWDSKWVLFKGDTVWDVPKEALDEIAASSLSKPFTMTLPPGLIILLLAGIGFGIFAYVTRNDDDYDPAEGQQDPGQGQGYDPRQQPPALV